MATRAESLIRQFCDQRRRDIVQTQQHDLNRIPERVAIRTLPPHVQRLIREYRQLSARRDRIAATLKRRGVQYHDLNRRTSTIHNPEWDDRRAAVTSRGADRLLKVESLRQQAYVDLIGQPGPTARKIVLRVQKALKAI